MTFGCYIIMVCAYGFQKKAFVAVDVLYARLKPLAQNILHLITYLVFFVPFVFVLVPESFGFFLRSYTTGEARLLGMGAAGMAGQAGAVRRHDAARTAGHFRDAQVRCAASGEAVSGTDDTKGGDAA